MEPRTFLAVAPVCLVALFSTSGDVVIRKALRLLSGHMRVCRALLDVGYWRISQSAWLCVAFCLRNFCKAGVLSSRWVSSMRALEGKFRFSCAQWLHDAVAIRFPRDICPEKLALAFLCFSLSRPHCAGSVDVYSLFGHAFIAGRSYGRISSQFAQFHMHSPRSCQSNVGAQEEAFAIPLAIGAIDPTCNAFIFCRWRITVAPITPRHTRTVAAAPPRPLPHPNQPRRRMSSATKPNQTNQSLWNW